MDKHLFYLIGPPGAGKTTAVRSALRYVPSMQCKEGLVSYVRYPVGAEIGVIRGGGFSGTDGLAMNAITPVLKWLAFTPIRFILAEGDRLGNGKFFSSVISLDFKLTVALLDCDYQLAYKRRIRRDSHQDSAWVQGRFTKVRNLVDQWVHPDWVLNGEAGVNEIVEALYEHPVFQAIGAVKLLQ